MKSTFKNALFGILFLIFLIFQHHAHCQLFSPDMGTIIITYQTDQTDEAEKRLDRIRFWLINDQQERTLYPKKDEIVSNDRDQNERTVVISHLPPGQYRIEFLGNADLFFEKVPPRHFNLASGEVVRIDQTFRPQFLSILESQETDELALIVVNYPSPYYPSSSIYPSSPTPMSSSTFSLVSNQNARWKLVLQGRTIYAGVGSVSNIRVPPGRNYTVVAERVPGYTFYTSPKIPFDIAPGAIIRLDLLYQRDIKQLEMERSAMNQQLLERRRLIESRNLSRPSITIDQRRIEQQNITVDQQAKNRDIDQQQVERNRENIIEEAPQRTENSKGTVQILSDSSQALFTLSTQAGVVIGRGQGYQYTFKDLTPGYYVVQFSSSDLNLAPSTQTQDVFVKSNQNIQLKISYRKLGRLIIKSSDRLQVSIQSVDNPSEFFRRTVTPPSQTFRLMEGRYQLSYQSEKNDFSSTKPLDIYIRTNHPLTLSLPDESTKPSKTGEAEQEDQLRVGIEVETNLTNAGFTLKNLEIPNGKSTHFQGKSIFVPLQSGGHFLLVFDPLPGYETPDPVDLTREADEHTYVKVHYTLGLSFVEVPEGSVIVGDPFVDNLQNERPPKEMLLPAFAIGVYEVTNAQYADWLNESFKNQTAVLGTGKLQGYILNKEGQVLCKTLEALQSQAQLTILKQEQTIHIMPVPGKEEYPVIEVTWYGAHAFCEDLGFRLPTEAEWEKAAGMSIPKEGEKPIKFKYGFGRDTIDRTWANYRDTTSYRFTESKQVLTTPIGFYNGINTLPLTMQDSTAARTNDAKSPVGAYDMSGNVWEWVETEEKNGQGKGSNRIVKGGCYDSLAQGVRVAERLSLPPDHADIYTGFRAAK